MTIHADGAGGYFVAINHPDPPSAYLVHMGGGAFAIQTTQPDPITHILTRTPFGVAILEI